MDSLAFESGFAPVFKGELYYEVAGSGQPMLFIHAGVADCSMWDEQFRYFSQSNRVVRYDTRGFGKSHSENTEFSNQQDILDLFKHLGIESAVIIGTSRGGQIAIDFTLEHPEAAVALVAIAAGISGYDYHPGDSEQARQEFELFTRMDELWEKNAFDELADLEVHVWADGPSQPVGRAPASIREYIYRIVRANYTRQDGKVTAKVLQPPATQRLNEIHVPTLVLVGEYDTTSTLEIAARLAAEVPGAQKQIFPGTAHMLPMELPGQFNQVLAGFLKGMV